MKKLVQLKDDQGNDLYSDSIVEQGENYIKFANGVMICKGTIYDEKANFTTYGNAYKYEVPYTSFPKDFIEVPFVTAHADNSDNKHSYATFGGSLGVRKNSTGIMIFIRYASGVAPMKIDWFAIGKWK